MHCRFVTLSGGGTAIVCGGRRGERRCHYCGAPTTTLCDVPTPGGGTCDRPICARHGTNVGPNRDYCDPQKSRRHPRLEAAA